MDTPDYLPEVAREIAEYIGLDGLMRLVNRYGGTVIRVPGRGDLKQVLTPEQYKEFVHVFRNEKLTIPRLSAKQYQLEVAETNRLLQDGFTRAEAARKLQVTERTIYNRQSQQKQNENQSELF
ncbi:hypothetical protein [Methylophaga nitratireducenticrescens]|uniref:hypothetical protein n=1 Tax=Methylophaga nitratireducenticrescens TaxID=754476 RepID=UPI000CDBF27D|nr:hypothetical protein [Methylophaga nitratireducenticrescens]AUZ85802.1 hypothetical protein CDW43_15065 [Methylophaga nitratireducenticrescens]AUZ85870.1 hypothetical protein CDW43_15420 [Methylophaga nitratireducenticrescens]